MTSPNLLVDVMSLISRHWPSFESFWQVELKSAFYKAQTRARILRDFWKIWSALYKVLAKWYYKYQYGFRRGHPTNHSLIEITEKIRKIFDLQKAFDTVNYEILLEKLDLYRTRIIKTRVLDLTWRKQLVSLNYVESAEV